MKDSPQLLKRWEKASRNRSAGIGCKSPDAALEAMQG